MSQPKRTETLERFKNSEIRLLVASDVAARGLDIQGLSHVFCFDVPYHAEDYVHRIGRTGRAGREGRSFMLAAPEDGKAVAAIQKLIGKEIPVASIAVFSPVELDFEGGDRRRGRRRPAPNGHRASDHSGDRPRARPAPAGEGRGDRQPRRRERAAPVEPRREASEPTVMVFPRPAPEPRHRREPERRPEQGPERRVVGFGDDLPAFLARAPRAVAGA
jgi:superfamily II DNA/RNA helicase